MGAVSNSNSGDGEGEHQARKLEKMGGANPGPAAARSLYPPRARGYLYVIPTGI
jgi:hypothetical protein